MIAAYAPFVAPPSAQPPTPNLVPRDVERLAADLVAYHARFAPLFQRSEQRRAALLYLQGPLLDLERKTIEPLAHAVMGGDVQALQQFIGQSPWDADAVLHAHHAYVGETLGDAPEGAFISDGCDFPKQGTESVGVARQWCGPLGKRANCQSGVVVCDASPRGYTLVDRRLYRPEPWFTPAYAARRRRCGVPSDATFRTHPELAGGMVAGLRAGAPARPLGARRRGLRPGHGPARPPRCGGLVVYCRRPAHDACLAGAPGGRRAGGNGTGPSPHTGARGRGGTRPGRGARAGCRPVADDVAAPPPERGGQGATGGRGRLRARGGRARPTPRPRRVGRPAPQPRP